MRKYGNLSKTPKTKVIRNIIVIAFWIAFIGVCLFYRDEITIENIVSYTPNNFFLAALVLLCLYTVKGFAVFIYGSILYAAGGIMFPLPLAILVNTIGTVIMTTIPYFIGRKAGRGITEKLANEHPKLQMVMNIQSKNDLFLCFFVRIVGFLPADIVAMYLGASGIGYRRYILGTVVGLFPSVILFSIMGMSIDDPTSPAFIISLAVEIGLAVVSLALFLLLRKRSGSNAK